MSTQYQVTMNQKTEEIIAGIMQRGGFADKASAIKAALELAQVLYREVGPSGEVTIKRGNQVGTLQLPRGFVK